MPNNNATLSTSLIAYAKVGLLFLVAIFVGVGWLMGRIELDATKVGGLLVWLLGQGLSSAGFFAAKDATQADEEHAEIQEDAGLRDSPNGL